MFQTIITCRLKAPPVGGIKVVDCMRHTNIVSLYVGVFHGCRESPHRAAGKVQKTAEIIHGGRG